MSKWIAVGWLVRSCGLVGLLAGGFVSPAAAQTTIDTFTDSQGPLAASGTSSSFVPGTGSNVLGNERDLRVRRISGTNDVTAVVAGGLFTFTAQAGTAGEAAIVWDGVDNNATVLAPSGLAGTDLTAGGATAVLLDVSSATVNSVVLIEVYSSAADSSVYTLLLPSVTSPTTFALPFAAFQRHFGAGAVFSNVGATVVTIRGTAATVVLDQVRAGALPAPSVSAAKTSALATDADSDTRADSGDTLQYTVTVGAAPSGAAGSTVTFSDTVGANTSLVAGSIQTSPVPFDDYYFSNGSLSIAGPGVLGNDVDPDADGLTVVAANPHTTSLGGSVTVNADGSFAFTPPSDGTIDTFTYDVTDGTFTSTAIVTVGIVDDAPQVTSTTPTNGTLQQASNTNLSITFSEPVNVSSTWFQIVCTTSGARNVADTVVSGGPTTFTINPNADFTEGESCTTTVFATEVTDQDPNDPPDQMAANFTFTFTVDEAPFVQSTSPANGALSQAANTNIAITFSEPVSVAGNWFQIVCPSSTRNPADTLVTGGPTTFTINPNADLPSGEVCVVTVFAAQVSDQDTGDPPDQMLANYVFSFGVIPLANDDTYANEIIGNVGVNTANASGFSVRTNDVAPGSPTVVVTTAPAHGTVILNASTGTFSYVPFRGYQGPDIFQYTITNAAGTSVPATVSLTVNGVIWFVNNISGACTVSCDGRLTNPYTTLAGFTAVNGVVGTGNPTTGQSIFLYESATSYAGPLPLLNGQRAIGQDATVSLASAAGFTTAVDSFALPGMNSGNATHATITSGGNGITLAQNNQVQGLTLSGTSGTALSSGGNAGTFAMADVQVANTTGAGIAFTGGATAVTATGTNTIVTTTGTALNVANTTIGASGLTFQSISSNGAISGIVLNNTGALGGLTVTGNSSGLCGGQVTPNAVGTPATITSPATADCTGGTIQASTGPGILLTSTGASVSLTRMRITGGSAIGISGTSVTGLSLIASLIQNNAPASATGEGLRIDNLFGSSSWTSTTITGSGHNNAWIRNTSGTLASLAISGTNFASTGAATGNDGLLFEPVGTSVVTSVSIDNSAFTSNRATGIQALPFDTANVQSFIVTNTSFTNNNIGMDFEAGSGATMKFKMQNNTIVNLTRNGLVAPNTTSHAINVNMLVPSSGLLDGKIDGNVIGSSSTPGSGSSIGDGIRVVANGNGQVVLLLSNNVIRECPDAYGMELRGRNGTGTMQLSIVGNNVNHVNTAFDPGTSDFPLSAIAAISSVSGTAGYTVKSDVRGNTVPSGTAFDLLPTFIEIFETAGTTSQLVDNPPASADATTELTEAHTNPANNNTGSASANAGVALIAGPLTQPSIP